MVGRPVRRASAVYLLRRLSMRREASHLAAALAQVAWRAAAVEQLQVACPLQADESREHKSKRAERRQDECCQGEECQSEKRQNE